MDADAQANHGFAKTAVWQARLSRWRWRLGLDAPWALWRHDVVGAFRGDSCDCCGCFECECPRCAPPGYEWDANCCTTPIGRAVRRVFQRRGREWRRTRPFRPTKAAAIWLAVAAPAFFAVCLWLGFTLLPAT